ncbi:hypothetical protein FISHEDRAFT_33203 [Fistulina hepatica ATCC 64428]|uniref:VPS37 C-terminal domain-containing protein n=1 Tax=Fistulina hepatica ATCC 64428 TaxID=1128425 RepID=A0A0D7ANR9_9AGAR|nr:hypothetical protein FISHEDRAFT_33203 [Fistulina hepatica ATCC 64428]
MQEHISLSTPFTRDFPELSHLTRDELQDLLNDPVYFQAIFYSLPRVKAMYEAQNELGMANESIAKSNLAMQDDLYALRAQTQEAFDEAKAMESRWKETERTQKEVYQRYSPQFLLMRLRHATTAQDDKSEALANSFISSDSFSSASTLSASFTTAGSETPSDSPTPRTASVPHAGFANDVEEFIREYRELRKVYHKRVMWGDRWASGQVEWVE